MTKNKNRKALNLNVLMALMQLCLRQDVEGERTLTVSLPEPTFKVLSRPLPGVTREILEKSQSGWAAAAGILSRPLRLLNQPHMNINETLLISFTNK